MDFYYYYMKSTVNEELGVINAVLKIDGNNSVPISTKIKTPKKLWNAKEQCFEGKNSGKQEALKLLFEKRMESIRDFLSSANPHQHIDPNRILAAHREDAKKIKTARQPANRDKEKFQSHFRLFLRNQEDLEEKERIQPITLNGFIAKRNVMMDYLKSKKQLEILTKDIDGLFIDEFSHWLIMKGHKDSTIAKYEWLIKRVIKFAYRQKLITENPVEDYVVKAAKEEKPISLEKEEIQLIDDLQASGKLNEYLTRTVDIYRFCVETSLSFCDYTSLNDSMLKVSETGTTWIFCERGKTEEHHRIPLSDKALEIIQKYGNLKNLPRSSNVNLNVGIKKIAKMVGIQKKLTFHTSRKTMINDLLNNKGMRETTIQAIVGWKDGRQLRRYARINNQAIEKEFFGK